MDTHDLFILSPLALKNFLNKEIELKLPGNKTCRGWVQSVDPISKSFILLKFQNEDVHSEITLVPGYSIRSIHIKSEPSDQMRMIIENTLRKKEIKFTKEELDKKREALCMWFSGNRVPYSLTSNLDIEVLQVAKIMPPYTTESISCKNEVVLDKVMKLVSTAPQAGNERKEIGF